MQNLPAFVVFSRIPCQDWGWLHIHPGIRITGNSVSLQKTLTQELSTSPWGERGVNAPQDFSVLLLDVLAKPGHSGFAFQPLQPTQPPAGAIPSFWTAQFVSSGWQIPAAQGES